MEATQSFRLIKTTNTVKITLSLAAVQNAAFGRRSSRPFQGSSALAMAIQSSTSLASQTRKGNEEKRKNNS